MAGWQDAPVVNSAPSAQPSWQSAPLVSSAEPAWKSAPEVAAPTAPTAPMLDQAKGYASESLGALATGAKQLGSDIKESVMGAPGRFSEAYKADAPKGGPVYGAISGAINAVGGAPVVQKGMEVAPALLGVGEGVPEVAKAPEAEAAAAAPKEPAWKSAPEVTTPQPQAVGAEAAPAAAKPGAKIKHEDVIEQENLHYGSLAKQQNARTDSRKAFEGLSDEAKTPEFQQKAYQHLEGDKSVQLSPEEQDLVTKHFEPQRKANAELYDEVKSTRRNLGLDDGELENLNPDYMHRMVRGSTRELDQALGARGEETDTGPGGSNYRGGTFRAPSTKERSYFAIEKDGARQLVHKQGKDLYKIGDDKTETLIPRDQWTDKDLKSAYTSEIEKNTDTQYIKHASGSLAQNHVQLTKMLEEANVVKASKAKMMQNGWGTTNKALAKKLGYHQSEFPGMQNFYMDPRMRGAMDKFAPKPRNGESPIDWLQRANSYMTGTLFWNPLGHARNVAMSSYIDRGWKNFMPQTYGPYAKALGKAWKETSEQSPRVQEIFEKGASLRYPSVQNERLFENMMKGVEYIEADKSALALAKKLGSTPAAVGRAIMKASHDALWHVNDALLVANIEEKVARGMSLEAAIKDVHKTIGDYRIPSEMLVPGKTGRVLSNAVASPGSALLFQFARYHYNMVKSIASPAGDMIKGLKSIGKEGLAAKQKRSEALDALGKVVSMGIAFEVLQHGLDTVAQKVSGEPPARAGAWGPLSLLRMIDDELEQRGDPKAREFNAVRTMTGGLLSPSTIVQMGEAAYGLKYDLAPAYPDKAADRVGNVAEQGFAPLKEASDAVKNPASAIVENTIGYGHKPKTEAEYKAWKKAQPKKPRK